MSHLVADVVIGDGQELKQTEYLQFCAIIQ
jgi:hypothetical protein